MGENPGFVLVKDMAKQDQADITRRFNPLFGQLLL
jgi:hypothetical protein